MGSGTADRDERLDWRIRVLAWAHIVLGGLGLGIGALLFLAAILPRDPALYSIAEAIFWVFGGLAIIYFIPSLIGGIGMMKGWTWARGVIWIASALLAVFAPIGTALSGLALWALLQTRPKDQGPANDWIIALEVVLRRAICPLVLMLIALAILSAIVGLGYLFRDVIDPPKPQELTTMSSGVPAPMTSRAPVL
jgi:hypothetical protein